MTGDRADMLMRLKLVLPLRWFPDSTPVLDAILSGFAATAAWAFDVLQYVKLQTRLATASAEFLDIAARDYFGERLKRRPDQSDMAFRAYILRELYRSRATRPAMLEQLVEITGRTPDIFEVARPADTGSWGEFSGYGIRGRYGSLTMPNQVLITVFRSSAPEHSLPDAEIFLAVAHMLPIATIGWTRISD